MDARGKAAERFLFIYTDHVSRLVESLVENQKLVAVQTGASLETALAEMGRGRVGTLLILKGSSLRGVFSERDLIRRVYAAGLDVRKTPIDDVMTSKVSTVRKSDDTMHCLALLKKFRCRSLPVIAWWNQAVGLVSIIDVLSDLTTALEREKTEYDQVLTSDRQLHFAPYAKQNLLKELIATQRLQTLTPDHRVSDAVTLMASANIGSVLLMADQQLLGIVSERDVLFKVAAKGLRPEEIALADIMTKTVTSIESSTSNAECLATMRRIGCRHLPVSENGKIVGVVSILNCLQWMYDEFNYYLDHWRTMAAVQSGPMV